MCEYCDETKEKYLSLRRDDIYGKEFIAVRKLGPCKMDPDRNFRDYADNGNDRKGDGTMERVNFPYQSAYDEGYRHAIMDAVNWLEGHSDSAHYFRMSYDHVIKILKLMRENYEGMFNGDFEILVVTDKDKPKKVKELRIKKK